MKFDRNPQIEHELLVRLRDKYLTPKPHPHVTELIYCLTKAHWDRVQPIQPTDKELLLFAVGFGLEEVLLRDKGGVSPESEQVDGVCCTEDYFSIASLGEHVDLKSTRMYPGQDGMPKKGWPETWLKQFMAYARKVQRLTYSVGVMYILPPDLVGGTFTFTQEELDLNWRWILLRRDVYQMHTEQGIVPEPYKWCEEWECRMCRYNLRCKLWVAEHKEVA